MKYEFESFKPEISNPVDSLHFEIGDPRIIFDMICNRIYSEPLQTAIQEYMCNGRDSHTEAGTPQKQVKVILPSKIDPAIHIRDFGMGISPQRMSDVFVKIGESTKRADNGQTGGFGVGAKSAFAYTDNFTIKTAFDGIERTYLAYIGENGLGDMDLVGEVPTTDENYTDISFTIAPEDAGHLEGIVTRTAMFWKVPPIVQNASFTSLDSTHMVPKLLQGGYKWGYFNIPEPFITDDWVEPFLACCDGVIYPLNIPGEFVDLFGDHRPNNEAMIFFFDVGEVDLAITRESLQYTAKTQKVVEARCRALIDDHKVSIETLLKQDLKVALPQLRDIIKTTPYIHTLTVELKDGVHVKVNNQNKYIDLKIDGINSSCVLTREHDVEPDMVKCNNIQKGIRINYDRILLVNDKNLKRIMGSKLRGAQEAIDKDNTKIDVITLPVSERDRREAYNRDEIAYSVFVDKVLPVLQLIGVQPISQFKNSKSTRMGYSQVYLDRAKRYGRMDKEKLDVDYIDENEHIIIIPPGRFRDMSQYVFFNLIEVYNCCSTSPKGLKFYYANTQRAKKIIDRLDVYDRFDTVWRELRTFIKSVHALSFMGKIYQDEVPRNVKNPAHVLLQLAEYKDQLPDEFRLPLEKIMEAKSITSKRLNDVACLRETYGPQKVPVERSLNELMSVVNDLKYKDRATFGSLSRAIKRTRKEARVIHQEAEEMSARLKKKFPLVFGSSNGSTEILENDVIPYIQIKTEGVRNENQEGRSLDQLSHPQG